MAANGSLGDVPLQINLMEFFMLIPQQLLPFTKINVAEWYLSKSSTKGYFMLNPVAQGAIGLGWFEIITRGALLAWVFSRIHNYFLLHGNKFWVTVFYLWMITQSYYSIRSSSFYFLTFILYRFLPFLILVIALRRIITVICRRDAVVAA